MKRMYSSNTTINCIPTTISTSLLIWIPTQYVKSTCSHLASCCCCLDDSVLSPSDEQRLMFGAPHQLPEQAGPALTPPPRPAAPAHP
eukprot:CAMPEP_0194668528 /NCGR_PEP_ID=MMETSP0295-20121207/4019_1 /TAXON_ID=39354 /ORGANISM="Heterosigma akashiwo, Strain CCMP2393" /LENGTH=86 /DNA_ID=CAMNT_0039551295 /DNA_START=21 /DNA_END=278 /DNA_ORIENTATION=-